MAKKNVSHKTRYVPNDVKPIAKHSFHDNTFPFRIKSTKGAEKIFQKAQKPTVFNFQIHYRHFDKR